MLLVILLLSRVRLGARGLSAASSSAAVVVCDGEEAQIVAAAGRGEIAEALALASSSSSQPATPRAWSSILSRLAADRSPALLRVTEEIYSRGLSLSDLDEECQRSLDGLLPPELPQGSIGLAGEVVLSEAPPDVWCAPSHSVRAVSPSDVSEARSFVADARQKGEPILLRAVGRDWAALRTWDGPRLAETVSRGMCRVSESSAVAFCRESHPDVRSGKLVPPSRLVSITGPDFMRALQGGTLSSGEERSYWYLQTLTPPELLPDVDLAFAGSNVESRLWACGAGTYSPTHYDATDSYLVQIRGRKRLLLWPPSVTMGALRPYDLSHALARRSGVDLTTTEHLPKADVDAITKSALEVTLEPGDAIWFPKGWAHHTENFMRGDEPLSIALSIRE